MTVSMETTMVCWSICFAFELKQQLTTIKFNCDQFGESFLFFYFLTERVFLFIKQKTTTEKSIKSNCHRLMMITKQTGVSIQAIVMMIVKEKKKEEKKHLNI